VKKFVIGCFINEIFPVCAAVTKSINYVWGYSDQTLVKINTRLKFSILPD
jgi:hypothetical protein